MISKPSLTFLTLLSFYVLHSARDVAMGPRESTLYLALCHLSLYGMSFVSLTFQTDTWHSFGWHEAASFFSKENSVGLAENPTKSLWQINLRWGPKASKVCGIESVSLYQPPQTWLLEQSTAKNCLLYVCLKMERTQECYRGFVIQYK